MVKNATLSKKAATEATAEVAAEATAGAASEGAAETSADATTEVVTEVAANANADTVATMGADQAEGLRSMFGEAQARFLCLACALDGDTAVQITMGLAHCFRQQGQRVLYIDEIPMQARQTIKSLSYTVRYDLAQALENDIALEKTIYKAEDNLWFSVALRMARSYKTRRLKLPNLMDRLQKLSLEIDIVLHATSEPIDGVMRALSKTSQPIVITAPDDASLIRAIELIREFSQQTDGRPISVVVVGGDTQEQGQSAFDTLSAASKSLLDQPLDLIGWLAATPLSNSTEKSKQPAGLIIPSTLYGKLATMLNHA